MVALKYLYYYIIFIKVLKNKKRERKKDEIEKPLL